MKSTYKTSLAALLLGAGVLAACDAPADDQVGYTPTAETSDTMENDTIDDTAGTGTMAGDTGMNDMESGDGMNGMNGTTDMAGDDMTNRDGAGTIAAIAAENDSLSTLVTAVTAADLVETLNGDGPYTVFAPPNSAFEALPEGTVASLLEPGQKEQLTSILTYHVVADEVTAAELTDAIESAENGSYEIYTVNGAVLTATIEDGTPTLTDADGNSAAITDTDIDASNGVVHLIDRVLMPGSGS